MLVCSECHHFVADRVLVGVVRPNFVCLAIGRLRVGSDDRARHWVLDFIVRLFFRSYVHAVFLSFGCGPGRR